MTEQITAGENVKNYMDVSCLSQTGKGAKAMSAAGADLSVLAGDMGRRGQDLSLNCEKNNRKKQ